MDLYKWELHIADREKMLPIMFELADKVEPKYGVKVRPMRKRDFENEVRAFMEVYNAAWENNWGFVPLTEDELRAYARELKPILDENWAWIAESAEGQVVGAALSIPDYNQVLAKLNGRLLPFGWAKALLARRKIDSVRVFALGVKRDWQHTGVAAKFYVEHFNSAGRTPQTWGEMGWILESNTAMNRGMEAMNGRIVKRYRLYGKPLVEGRPSGE
jgi:hypothetical protein